MLPLSDHEEVTPDRVKPLKPCDCGMARPHFYPNWCPNDLKVFPDFTVDKCRKSSPESTQCRVLESAGFKVLYGDVGNSVQACDGGTCSCTQYIEMLEEYYERGAPQSFAGRGLGRFLRFALASESLSKMAYKYSMDKSITGSHWMSLGDSFKVEEHVVVPNADSTRARVLSLLKTVSQLIPVISGIWISGRGIQQVDRRGGFVNWLLRSGLNSWKILVYGSLATSALKLYTAWLSKRWLSHKPATITHIYSLVRRPQFGEQFQAPEADLRNRTNNYAQDPLQAEYGYVKYSHSVSEGWVYSGSRIMTPPEEGQPKSVLLALFHGFHDRYLFSLRNRPDREKYKILCEVALKHTHIGSGKIDLDEEVAQLISRELFDQVLNASVQSLQAGQETLKNRVDQRTLNSTCVNISSRLGFTFVTGVTSRVVLAFALHRRQVNGHTQDHILYDSADLSSSLEQ